MQCYFLTFNILCIYRDIASAMGRQAATLLNKPVVNQLLSEAYENGDANTQETCNWAKSVIQQAVQP